jgi:hypothetical protein
MAVAPARVQVIEEVTPFGDVALAPAAATGRSEAELARAITGPRETAPWAAEPVASLGARLGVGALMRRGSRARAEQERKRAA